MSDDEDTFSISDVINPDTDTRQNARRLIPWLPDPHQCDCGVYCEAKDEFVQEQAMIMPVWVCPECESRFYRGEE